MERRQIGLRLVLDKLDLPVTIDSFDNRLILQKAIYLAQAAGVSLGYYYRADLLGPHCPAVAEDGFAVSSELSQGVDDAKEWKLDPASSEKLARVRQLLAGSSRPDLVKKLELLASVHYLVDRHQVAGRDPKVISETLQRFDKLFGEQEVTVALGELTTHDILS